MHTALPFVKTAKKPTPLHVFAPAAFEKWLKKQAKETQNWFKINGFTGATGRCTLFQTGSDIAAVAVVGESTNPYVYSFLANALPEGFYKLANKLSAKAEAALHLGWGLESYTFIKYKKSNRKTPKLVTTLGKEIKLKLDATFLVRDLINTPTADMGTENLAKAAKSLATTYKAKFKTVVGKDLLKKNFPAIYAVGKGGSQAPRYVEFTWGKPSHPKVTLVGKGIVFDTGGLNIKPSNLMKIMKKDMGGAAIVLGLAKLIMGSKLPVRLKVIIGAAENSIDAVSMRPKDVVPTRKGTTIEINHTDAEGRVVLADCLWEASKDNPALIMDFATLTGAARVGLGTEIATFLTNDPKTFHPALLKASEATHDQTWPLPLHENYRRFINSQMADLSNEPTSRYGGTISAALFLREFVKPNIPWVHFDIMAYNALSLPGRPKGGEPQGMSAAFEMLCQKFGKK